MSDLKNLSDDELKAQLHTLENEKIRRENLEVNKYNASIKNRCQFIYDNVDDLLKFLEHPCDENHLNEETCLKCALLSIKENGSNHLRIDVEMKMKKLTKKKHSKKKVIPKVKRKKPVAPKIGKLVKSKRK